MSAVLLDTGAGTDTLDFSNVTSNLNITVHADGTTSVTDGVDSVNNIAGAENIVGGTGTNTYTFEDGASIAGTITGGSNVLDYSAYTTAVNVDLQTGAATGTSGTSGASGVVNVIGGSGNDTLTGADAANAWSITGVNAGTVGSTSFSGIENLAGGTGADSFTFAALSSVDSVAGNAGSDTLDLSSDTSGVTVDLSLGTASYAGAISGIEDVVTGAGNDTIVGALSAVLLDTGAGTDTLDFSNVLSNLNITVPADGTTSVTDGVDTVSNIAGAENVVGGTGTNTYTFEDGAVLNGSITGGSNVLDHSANTTGISVNLNTNTTTGVTGTVSNIVNVIGGAGNDTLTGADTANTWNITGVNAGSVSGVSFSGIENLAGGIDADSFTFAALSSVDSVAGNAGSDTLDLSSDTAGVTVDLSLGTASYAGAISGIEDVVTGAGNDTIVGALSAVLLDTGAGTDTLDFSNVASNLNITVHAGGTLSVTDGVDSVNNIAGAENIVGGTGTNTYTFEDGASIAGNITGGSNILNYSAYTTNVSINLNTNTATGTGGASSVVNVIGGTGNDTLTGADTANTWNITGVNAGSVSGVSFSGIENLAGGTDSDSFTFAALSSVDSVAGGGGSDTLDLSSDTTGVTVDLSTGTASYAGTISDIENVVTGAGNDTIIGTLSAVLLDTGAGTDTLDFSNVASNLNITVHVDGTTSVTDGVDTVNNIAGAENIVGGTGTNTYIFEDGASITGNITGGSNVLDYSANTTGISVNLNTNTATGVTGTVSNIVNVIGGTGSDTLTGADSANAWNITGVNAGSVSGVSFSGIENLAGGTGADSFTFAALSSVDSVTGGDGSDTLDLSSDTTGVTVNLSAGTASYAGTISDIEDVVTGAGNDTIVGALSAVLLDTGAGTDTLDFSNITSNLNITVQADGTLSVSDGVDTVSNIAGSENIVGGTGTNTYTFEDGASIAGNITGGSNVLDHSANTTGISVNLNTNTATGVTGTVANVVSVIGGAGNDTLTGADSANAWSITGVNTGTVGSTSFSNIENLAGGTGADSFTFAALSSVDSVAGGGVGSDTLIGSDSANTWSITGANAGDLAGIAFSEIENLTGGVLSDLFAFAEGAGIGGVISAGLGSDTLDYSAWLTGVSVDLSVGTASGTGGIGGFEDVTGSAGADILTGDGGANLLIGGASNDALSGGGGDDTLIGEAGVDSIIGGLGIDTLLAEDIDNIWNITGLDAGTLNSEIFTGVEHLVGGNTTNTYVFADGAAVTGSITGAGTSRLDHSANTTGINVDLNTNTATGVTGTVANIVNVIGGSGNDTLTGADGANAWNITGVSTGTVGGVSFSSIENLGGGAGADSFTFSTGSAVDSVTGGGGSDTLAGADTANSWNITGLNSGTMGGTSFSGIENLQGGADADSFTFSEGADIAGTIFGNAGSDVLDYSATISGVFIDLTVKEAETVVGGAGSDTLSGPAADTDWTIDGADSGNVAGVTFFSGIENLTGAADNEDTFTFTATGSLSGVVAGGDGGFDSIIFSGSYSEVAYDALGPDSGTMLLDGMLLTFTGMEPITLSGTPTDTITFSGKLLIKDDHIRLLNHETPGMMTIGSDTKSFEEITFATHNLVINAGFGDDTIVIESIDPTFDINNLTVNGGFGTDTLITGELPSVVAASAPSWFDVDSVEQLDAS